ncbi:MAG: hypothetical protein ACP5I1_16045, partial [Candidatus Hinthialibacter sp.]
MMVSKIFKQMQKITMISLLFSASFLLSIPYSEAQNENYPINPNLLQNRNPNLPNLNAQNQPNLSNVRDAVRNNLPSNRRTRSTRSSQNQPEDSASGVNPASSRFTRTVNPTQPGQGGAPSLPQAPQRSASPAAPPTESGGGIQVQGARSQKYQTGFGKDESEEQIRQNASLYLRPSKAVAVVRQPVTVDVVLSNKKKLEFDRLSFLLQYDPKDVLVTSGEDAAGDWIPIHEIPISAPKSSPVPASGETESKPELLA